MPAVALIQGLFWLVTGLWPILHMPSFLAVTGPKRDLWLVRTVGALIAVVGGVLVVGGSTGRVTPEIAMLGIGGAAALATVDVVYVTRGVIPKIYLLDAVAEAAIIVAWAVAWMLQ